MKKILDCFSVISIILVIIISLFFINISSKKAKYEQIKLGLSLQELKSNWGKPDKLIANNYKEGNITLFYKTHDFWGDYYVFSFDKDTRKLLFKYYDD